MRKLSMIALLAATACRAGLIPVGISPAGTGAAIGLSPSNEVPAVTNSSGSGGSISGGVTFDSDALTLQLAFGFGSAAGFADLTGPATDVTINGPAGTNQTNAVLFDLGSMLFVATNAQKGGVVFGSITVSSNQVSDLLSGLDYINVTTSNNPAGEIRGQLVPLLPSITCPEDATNECGSNYTEAVAVSDPAGLGLSVVWSANGVPLQTNTIAAGTSTNSTNVAFSGSLPLGTNLLEVTATDSQSNSVSCSNMVLVVDTIPPVILSASAKPCVLWPPNHKLVTVTVCATVTNNCGATTWKIISVKSNEAVNEHGSGNTMPDWIILSDHTVALRAERSGMGNGRVYCITIQAEDEAGNLSQTAVVKVIVPKSQGHGDDQGDDNDQGGGKGNGHGKDEGNGKGKGD